MAAVTTGQENDSHLARILAIETLVVVIAVTSVTLRLYVRIKLIKSIGGDDWSIGGAAICSIAAWILYIYRGFHGLGRHIEFVSTSDELRLSEASFWQVILSSCLGMALLKISIALHLLRLSPSRWYTWCLWLSIAFVAAYCFMGAMTFFLYCKPMKAFWDHTIKDAKCYSIHLFITFALINTAFNIFTDVLFATLPIPIIWRLQMKRKIRLYLIGVLSLGYTAVAFGITNGVYQIAFSNNIDVYINDSILFFAILQVNTGIIAACVPSIKPLVSKALNLSDYTYSNSRLYGNHSNRYGSRYAGQPRPTEWNDPYALEELHSNEDENGSNVVRSNATRHSATSTFYQSGSEEMILDDRDSNNAPQGIMMTTEINVH